MASPAAQGTMLTREVCLPEREEDVDLQSFLL
jgi:hypothetical protein